MIHFIFCFWICFGVEKKKSKYFFTQEEHSVKILDCNLFGISRYSRVFSKLRHCMSHFSKYLFLSKPNFSHLTKCRKAFFIHSKHALGNNQRKKILIVTSENDCILVTLQHINSEASKAFTSEALLTADNTEISIQTSSKIVAPEDSIVLQLYTTTEIPQLYWEESSEVRHFKLSWEAVNNKCYSK